MPDKTELGRSVPKGSQPSGARPPRRRSLVLAMMVLLFLAATAAGYFLGIGTAFHPLEVAMEQIQTLQPEVQKLRKTNIDLTAALVSVRAKLANIQATLETIMPTKDSYIINSNQSLNVANGRLIIGLVGSPTNSSINININGKQQPAVSGDVFKVSPDPSTACVVTVQSFDMFKVVVVATCAAR